MEFWGIEVKSGEPFRVEPGVGMVLHLSQACLGEIKKDKGNEAVCLFVNVDGKKLVLGTLYPEKLPQQQFDLVFDREFELSHNWKNGSVYFYGYRANNPFDESEDEFDSDEEDLPINAVDNGKPQTQAKLEKTPATEKANAAKESAAGKQKVKIVEPNKDLKPEEDEDSDDESDESSGEEPESDEDEDDESDDDGEGEESDEDDEDTPMKVEPSKKRPSESATKTPGSDKKAKLVTPQKTDGKKAGVHVATPHPSKQAGKTPANKPNQQAPKSSGSHACKSCNRTFNSANALESHTKAKHSAGK